MKCKKPFDPEKSGGGGLFWNPNVNLENSRFDWVFLNVGLPNREGEITKIELILFMDSPLHLVIDYDG